MSQMSEQIQTAREQIKAGSRLRRMRLGQEAPEFVNLRSNPEIRLALVPLTEAESEYGLKAAMTLPAEDNELGILYRDRWQQVCDLWNALREPHDVTNRIYETPQEMVEELETLDINYLSECYMRMLEDTTPSMDGVSDEQLEELKKAFVTIDWSVLSGKAWWHLKQCLFHLGQGQLKVKLPGSLSTENLITKNDESESTPTA
jgi:hypothetical protein